MFPADRAARIARATIRKFLNDNTGLEKVAIVCFDNRTFEVYLNELNRHIM